MEKRDVIIVGGGPAGLAAAVKPWPSAGRRADWSSGRRAAQAGFVAARACSAWGRGP